MSTTVRLGQRDPAKELFWRQTVAEFEAADLSVREFCRQRGLSEKRFFTWRRNLRDRDQPRLAPPTPTPATFVPVRVTTDPTLEIALPSGVTLRTPVHADPAVVARLVAALVGGASC
jgi:transposase-like protein